MHLTNIIYLRNVIFLYSMQPHQLNYAAYAITITLGNPRRIQRKFDKKILL